MAVGGDEDRPVTAAVDGKTSEQADDTEGAPIHVLNVFAHGANVCLADWPVGGGKNTEPDVLKGHLDELFAAWPSLRVLTGDALFCQRPLALLSTTERESVERWNMSATDRVMLYMVALSTGLRVNWRH